MKRALLILLLVALAVGGAVAWATLQRDREYHRLLAKAKEEQKEDRGGDVDYLYEVTADLGKHLTGFRHDIVDDSIRFEVLTVRPFTPFEPKQSSPQHSSRRTGSAHPASGKPWWKFW